MQRAVWHSQVAEGVETAFSLEKLLLKMDRVYRRDLKFPIVFGVCQVSASQVRRKQQQKNTVPNQRPRSDP
jgi:hypothetical protein